MENEQEIREIESILENMVDNINENNHDRAMQVSDITTAQIIKSTAKELRAHLTRVSPKLWVSVEDRLPKAKEPWSHSERCLVWYEGSEHKTECYGIAYYHYEPLYDGPHWTDFANYGRTPKYWCEIERPFESPPPQSNP